MSTQSDAISDEVKVETPPRIGIVERNHASAMLQSLADRACRLQNAYPLWSTSRVLEAIRSSAEQGEFGDMHPLLFPSAGGIGIVSETQESCGPSQQLPVHPGYPTYIASMPCVPSVMQPTPRAYARTVNPSTLTVMDHPFNFNEELGSSNWNGESDGGTSAFVEPDFERLNHGYVSVLGLGPELMPHDPQDTYVVCHPSLTYSVEPRDVYYRGHGFS